MGPSSPVIAKVGAEAVFSCHLNPSTDAQDMEIKWFHTKNSDLVHYYRSSQDILEKQQPEYRGRTELLKDKISQGQVALRIRSIRPSDGGDYNCSFTSSTHHSAAQFSVEVTGQFQVMGPRSPVIAMVGKEAVFSCHLKPAMDAQQMEVTWYKNHQSGLVHDYRNGQEHVEQQQLEYCGRTQFLKGNISQGQVALRLQPIRTSDAGVYRCLIASSTGYSEAQFKLLVTGDLFTRVSPWTVVLAVFDVLVAISLAVIGAILMRTTKAKEILSEELEERSSIGGIDLEEARRYAEDITLDADTAHPSLHVSHGGKHVETLPLKQDVPDKSARFTLAPFVLGQKSFSSGHHYWEVEVPDKYTWNVGLCLDSVKRKISYNYTSPENGFWSISRIDRRYDALSVPRFVVNVENPPLKIVGIFLQYEKGLISFYDVKASSILYTFKSKFTQPLKPYFSPGPHIPGGNQAFKILQVPGGSRVSRGHPHRQ
ncbi:butyrophilin subfamily 1 member A1-like [Ictidomys tridecemlineatus]